MISVANVVYALYAKYVVFVVKGLVLLLGFFAAPGLSTQAGSHPTDSHGSAAATDSHEANSHAAPAAHEDAAHGDAAHAEPAHAEAEAEADHAEPAHAEAEGDHAEPAHATVAKDPHGSAHGEMHGEAHPPAALGHKRWGVPVGVWHAINFFLLFGAIFWLVRKGLAAAVRSKREATVKGIEEATKLRDEMRKKFEDYDARMRTIDERMNAIVADAKSEAESEKTRLVSEAGALGARIREDAKLVADQEIARAKRELQEEQIARAGELAEQMLRTSVTKEDHARLADEFMSRVGKNQPEAEGRGWGSGGEAPGNNGGRA